MAEGEAGSWSDVEEERERQAFVYCNLINGSPTTWAPQAKYDEKISGSV